MARGGTTVVYTTKAEAECSHIMQLVSIIIPIESFEIECASGWKYRVVVPGQSDNTDYDIYATTIVRFDYEKPEIRGREWK